MPISDEYRKIRGNNLYHYTHRDNLPQIAEHRNIYCNKILKQKGIKLEHITDRDSRLIDKARGYDNYVFLVFSQYHPLIYKGSKNGIPIERISIDVSILDLPGVVIADRVATDNLVKFYTPEDALEVLKIKYCHTNGNIPYNIWEEVKKYEILIPGNIDLNQYYSGKRKK